MSFNLSDIVSGIGGLLGGGGPASKPATSAEKKTNGPAANLQSTNNEHSPQATAISTAQPQAKQEAPLAKTTLDKLFDLLEEVGVPKKLAQTILTKLGLLTAKDVEAKVQEAVGNLQKKFEEAQAAQAKVEATPPVATPPQAEEASQQQQVVAQPAQPPVAVNQRTETAATPTASV